MDMATVHQGEEFIKYNVSLNGYGYYGDCLVDSERNRWMGPKRYDWAGRNSGHVTCTLFRSPEDGDNGER